MNDPGPVYPECPLCHGAGTILVSEPGAPPFLEVDEPCPECDGTGDDPAPLEPPC